MSRTLPLFFRRRRAVRVSVNKPERPPLPPVVRRVDGERKLQVGLGDVEAMTDSERIAFAAYLEDFACAVRERRIYREGQQS